MKNSSLIRKKYSFNNIQILSKYELQNKFELVLKSITPKEIISDLSFFKEISIYFDSSSPEKAFIAYKFTLFCFYLANYKESNFFLKLFIKYTKIFIKTCHKYNAFVIIKIIINNVFMNDKTKKLSINEFNQIINSLLDEYKNDPYNSIMKLNFQNFTKNDIGKSLFFILLDCFKFAFNKDQIKAISKYLVAHSIVIIENILNDKNSKISYFKKLNNIVQSHIKEIQDIITNNNSKKKCIFYMGEFFISVIAIYDEIIRLFDMGLYDFYDKDFIIGYIQKNLVVTIMKFLEKKYFILDEKITSSIIKLSTNIENYLLNKVKIEQKKFFIEYSWIMAQFFDFLYHCEDKTKSIEYGNKIIELYRKKSYVSRAVIFIKLTLYENLLKIQKKSFSEYNIEDNLNNISDLITMFGNCEIENEESERYLIKMINHLFQIMIEHIIFIINNRRTQIKNLYNLLLLINPFLINCRDNSVNKNVVKKVNYFNTFCFITTIISSNNDANSKENNIYKFLKESNLNEEEKNLFINIISIFCIYDKNNLQKIFQLLKDLYNTSEDKYFLDVYFKIFYQLEKNEYYNITLLYNLLNLLINFMNEKLNTNNNTRNGDINLDFSNNYFPIYSVYVFNTIKFSHREILKVNEKENGFDQNNNIDSEGLLIKLSNCIKIINKFIEFHNQILDIFYKMDKDINSNCNKSIYYLHYNIVINFLLEFLDIENEYTSKNVSLIYQQLYLVATNKTIFSSLPLLTQNFIYYCLYRLIHNVNSILKNRDLFLINGNFEVSKTIKTIIYNNILLIKEERKKIKKNNDSFFNLELLLSSSIMGENCDSGNISFYTALNEKKFILNEPVKNQFNNFKINFIIDSNSLIEAIKLHYLIGNPIDKEYMKNYFDYYIPILNNEKQFGNKFSNILNIFYLIKRIFEIPKTGNQNEKINVELLCEIIKKKGNNFITKKNIIVRLLVKYIYSTQGKWENKKKINDLLLCLLNELNELKKDKNIVNNEQKNQSYLTYIELISLEYFINVYNGELSDNNIDELLYKGKKLLMKCIELFKAFLNEKYIMQYLPNEKHRLRSFNDYFFDEINKVDLIYSKLYLLNMDDYEYILLQLLNKIYILTDFLFKKMYSFGLGDSILEIFHKFRTFSIFKFNKFYFAKFISYVIKVARKWKIKREYDITGDINDFKNDSEYDIFMSKIYFNYVYSLYSQFKYKGNDNFCNFKINEFINENQIKNDPLLNKCLELYNINENSTDKEKNIFFKNKIKSLINQDIYNNNNKNNDIKELQNLFLKIFNISHASNYYLANFLSIDNKYIINILPKLFNQEIISHIILNEKNIEIIISLFKSCYKSFKIDNWNEYKYIKYCKKNLRNLIYLSSSSQIYDISLKLINLYIENFHNFKYNFSYTGNINQDKFILNEDDKIDNSNNNIDNLETADNISCDNGNEDKINIENTAIILNKINVMENNFYASNIISVFRIRNLFYIYLKVKNESAYDIINMNTENDFQMFFNNMKNISLNENSSKKIKKKAKNEEYRKALFELQNIFIKHCPNFIKIIKLYYYSHTNFNNYINTKIKKYSLKISSNEIINWIFEPNVDKIKYKHVPNFNNTNTRLKLMSIIDYKKKFINKIFNSNKFKFSFYEGNINDLFYYLPSVELSKIPIENIPLLFNLVIIRSLNTNYIKLNPIRKNISITKEIFCLLNPKKDLVDTEKKILPIINKYKIKCINSKEPTEQEMNSIINNKLMYLYCGHGDSLKYLKKEYIESHKIKFLTFLFGCNSANSRLISGKDTQPLSTPQLFLKQLCPFFFGFLWPVSSLDLDEITVELLDILFKSKNQISLIKTISLLKRKFNLRWFNGAALVIYCNCDILTKFEE